MLDVKQPKILMFDVIEGKILVFSVFEIPPSRPSYMLGFLTFMHTIPKIGHAPQWQTTHLFWKLDYKQSLFCCEIRPARTKSRRDRPAVSCQAAISSRCNWRPCCSQMAASPLVDHVRPFPVCPSRTSQQKRLLAVYLKTRTCWRTWVAKFSS